MSKQFYFLSPVEVMRVSNDNLEEVAEWCGGRVATIDSNKVAGRKDTYVWVPTPKSSMTPNAFPGMFVTKRVVVNTKGELKTTWAVFKRDYFDKNYFDEPIKAVDATWGRQDLPKKVKRAPVPKDLVERLAIPRKEETPTETTPVQPLPDRMSHPAQPLPDAGLVININGDLSDPVEIAGQIVLALEKLNKSEAEDPGQLPMFEGPGIDPAMHAAGANPMALLEGLETDVSDGEKQYLEDLKATEPDETEKQYPPYAFPGFPTDYPELAEKIETDKSEAREVVDEIPEPTFDKTAEEKIAEA